MSDLIAALDVGTNSFHLVVAKPTPTGFEVVTREREVGRASCRERVSPYV